MRLTRWIISIGSLLCWSAGPIAAAPLLFDDFEQGIDISVWSKWPGSTEILQASTSHNYTSGGNTSALAWEADPWSYTAVADFGATSGFVRAEVYVYDDVDDDGTNPSRPVTNMLQISGAEAIPDFNVDYLQVGVAAWFPAGSTGYGFRTKYADDNALGFGDAGVTRSVGWTKLAIEADAVNAGGQVRFYVNDNLVGTSQRSGPLQYVRLGNTSKSYDNFWYDDVLVTPEPAGLIALLLMGALGLLRKRRA